MQQKRNDNRLLRAERLRGTRLVSQLFELGESHFAYPIRYVVARSEECNPLLPIEVLFSVPKRFHRRANKRNLLRRRIKEAYRLNRNRLNVERLNKGLHIALIYSTKEVHDYSTINRSINKIIDHINEQYCSNEQA